MHGGYVKKDMNGEQKSSIEPLVVVVARNAQELGESEICKSSLSKEIEGDCRMRK